MATVANAQRWAVVTMLLVLLLASGIGLAPPAAASADDPPSAKNQVMSEKPGGLSGSTEGEGAIAPSVIRSPQEYAECVSPSLPIPDPGGVTSEIVVGSSRYIGDMNVYVDLTHTWVGDLVLTLEHVESGTSVTIIDRPGVPALGDFGCSQDSIAATLDDEAATPVENECAVAVPTISGAFKPNDPLRAFAGKNAKGTWRLTVSDHVAGDVGTLNQWCLIGKERVAYAVDSDVTDHLWMIDLETNVATDIGPVGFTSVEALAFAPDGTLYGIDDITEELITLDLTTGAGRVVGALGVAVNDPGLAFDVLGNLWMVDDGTWFLYRVNPSSGHATTVGGLGQPVTGLAARGMVLFGLGGDHTNNLVTINTATGAATSVGSLVDVDVANGGLDFDTWGTLWGISNLNPDTLFMINPDTGDAEPTGAISGAGGIENLAIPPAPVAYTVDSDDADRLWLLYLNAGIVIDVGPASYDDIAALAFAPDGTLYGIDDVLDYLITLDLTTGAGSYAGWPGVDITDPGLAFDLAGNLWMVDNGTQKLYSVNLDTGLATAIGSLGQKVTGLTARGMTLYGLGGDGANNLVTINTATGAATPVGPLVNVTVQDGGLGFDMYGNLWGIADTGPTTSTIFTSNPATGKALAITNVVGAYGFDNLALLVAPRSIYLPLVLRGS